MREKLLIACAFLFFAEPALAQRTIVSGTVTDSGGVVYAGASLTASLVLPVGAIGAYLGGAQIAGSAGPVQLDATGSFLLQLADNTQIQCSNAAGQIVACAPQTQWAFRITLSPGVAPPVGSGPQTCNATLTISGASQSVTPSFNTCPKLIASGVASPAGTNGQIQYNNNGAFGGATCTWDTTNNRFLCPDNTSAVPTYSFTSDGTTGIFKAGSQMVNIGLNGAETMRFSRARIEFEGDAPLTWPPSFNTTIAPDTGVSRMSAGVLGLGNGTFQDTSGGLKLAAVFSVGTTFTASGCGNTTLVGGATAGRYTSVTAGACTVTITMGNGATAPNGWTCDAHDITTVADANNVTLGSSTTTTANLVEGTVAANDVIAFKCTGF